MRKKPLILVAFLVMLYIAPLILISSYGNEAIPAEQTMTKDFAISSDWYDEDWHYRKNVIMYSGLGGLDAPYTVKVVVPYDTDMQADFDDIRFTDNDNVTLLDYWLETANATYATFWVNVTDSQEWGTYFMIQMYYGNDAVSSTSDGEATFLFFDDFENNNLDRWDFAGDNWDTHDGEGKYGDFAVFGDAADTTVEKYLTHDPDNSYDYGILFHMWVRVPNIAYPSIAIIRAFEDDATQVYPLQLNENDWRCYNGDWVDYYANGILADTWYRTEIALDFTNDLFRSWFDRVEKGTTDFENSVGEDVTEIDKHSAITDTGSGWDVWMDDVYIRKWVHNEPEFNSWGEEENNFPPPEWVDAGIAIILFEVPVFTGSLDALLIFLGLIMIPASTLYFVKGGKEDMSSDKLFYCLIAFAMGWALFLGGIM